MGKPSNPILVCGRREWSDDDGCPQVEELGDITLRDIFAGMAMHGIFAAQDSLIVDGYVKDLADGVRAGGPVARAAYAQADAMLKAREVSDG